jgi:hypothetical protein
VALLQAFLAGGGWRRLGAATKAAAAAEHDLLGRAWSGVYEGETCVEAGEMYRGAWRDALNDAVWSLLPGGVVRAAQGWRKYSSGAQGGEGGIRIDAR